MKIVLLRHGECSTNGCYTGSGSDVSINKEGIIQIEEFSNKLSKLLETAKTKVFCSKLKRAVETLNIIESNHTFLDIAYDERLNEIDFGKFEGLNYESIMSKFLDIATKWYDNPLTTKPPDGEDFNNFLKRIENFWDYIKKEKSIGTKSILIISHGGVIQVLSTYICNKTISKRWDYNIARGSFTTFDI